MKIAILFSNYGPYHLARLNAFREICEKRQWQLNAVELFRHETTYPWNELRTDLPIKTIKPDDARWHSQLTIIPSCLSVLNSIRPNVLIIAGYGSLCLSSVILWAKLLNISIVLMSDSKKNDSSRSPLRESIKKRIVRQCQAALVCGDIHKDYLVELGMSDKVIFKGYGSVGNDSFNPSQVRHLPRPLENNFFLTVSRFEKKKNLHFLIDCYADYLKKSVGRKFDLVICGGGFQKLELERHISQLGLKHMLHLITFLPLQELLKYYAHASCLIHASIQEQWGLVVNEAMAAGLPVLVSRACGCFNDLVVEGINGYGFDPNNHAELTQLMLKVAAGDFDLAAMGENSLKLISSFTPQIFADNLAKAVECALRNQKEAFT